MADSLSIAKARLAQAEGWVRRYRLALVTNAMRGDHAETAKYRQLVMGAEATVEEYQRLVATLKHQRENPL